MIDELIIGLDLGGTFIKAVLIDRDGSLRSEAAVETQAAQGPEHVIGRLHHAAREVCERAGCNMDAVLGVGLGSPGPLSADLAVVVKSANLPGWNNVPLRDRIADLTGRPVAMTNDANAATYGEFWLGAGRGAKHICMLTLGTGVGGGVIVGGELLHGHFGNAGELGHLVVAPGGVRCRCGQCGCLETIASSSYLVEKATREARRGASSALAAVLDSKGEIDVPDLLTCARQGDGVSQRLWADACAAIAAGCVLLHHAFNPQYIVLGGGMAAASDALLEPVRREFAELTWKLADDKPEIVLASLGGNAGAIGAAGWFLHLKDRNLV
ncbi:MAG: ROK family protein [Planctomycetes bacterium]|nr:ROK family protein [Planctomycetota bacterium]